LQNTRLLNDEESKKYISLRRRFHNPVIGVSGNLGRTSTLEMISSLLESRGKVLRNTRGYGSAANNLKLLEKLSMEYDYALFEFDYHRGNNIGEILRIIKPTIGIVTNIGDAHLNYLSGAMRVVLEKSALVKYLARDGLAILNKDDELSISLSDAIATNNIVQFGLNKAADYYATDIQQLGPEGTKFKISGKYDVQLPVYSIQDVYNFLAAAACAQNLGFTLQEIIDIFSKDFELAAGHGRLHKAGSYYLLDESYLATPRSLSKAARALIGFRPYSENLILIAGDMAGAGVNVEEQHLNMGYFLSALPIKNLITIGEYAKFIAKGASLIKADGKQIFSVNTINEVLNILNGILSEEAVISIKGVGRVAAHRILKFLNEKQNT